MAAAVKGRRPTPTDDTRRQLDQAVASYWRRRCTPQRGRHPTTERSTMHSTPAAARAALTPTPPPPPAAVLLVTTTIQHPRCDADYRCGDCVAAGRGGCGRTVWAGPVATMQSYTLAHPCPTCHARPGQPCAAPRKARAADPAHRYHLTRQSAGIRHYTRDVRRAPWPEQRVTGERWDSLPGSPTATATDSRTNQKNGEKS